VECTPGYCCSVVGTRLATAALSSPLPCYITVSARAQPYNRFNPPIELGTMLAGNSSAFYVYTVLRLPIGLLQVKQKEQPKENADDDDREYDRGKAELRVGVAL
jgi:hypothetical protein